MTDTFVANLVEIVASWRVAASHTANSSLERKSHRSDATDPISPQTRSWAPAEQISVAMITFGFSTPSAIDGDGKRRSLMSTSVVAVEQRAQSLNLRPHFFPTLSMILLLNPIVSLRW